MTSTRRRVRGMAIAGFMALVGVIAGGVYLNAPRAAVAAPQGGSLERPVPELALDAATFEQAIDKLREKLRANVFIDWSRIERLDAKRRVTLSLSGVDLARALDVVLAAYHDAEAPLAYSEENGVITIFQEYRDGSARPSMKVVWYFDVTDFTGRFISPNVPPSLPSGPGLFGSVRAATPPPWVAAPATGVGSARVGYANYTPAECIDYLVKVIEDAVDTNSWRDNGGQLGSIKEANGLLIVEQTLPNQRRVKRVLANLRRIRDDIDHDRPPSAEPYDLLKE